MDKKEFKEFCHNEFIKRGFKKHKSTYYLNSTHKLLCGLSLQSSYGSAYYINCDFFIGNFEKPALYPSHYDFDLTDRPICVISKVTYMGEHFLTPLIEYEKYTIDELIPYFNSAFDNYIMPPIAHGKRELLEHLDTWRFPHYTVKSKEDILKKLYV